jgi:hypothetical protein
MTELRTASAAIRDDIAQGRWPDSEWFMGQVAVWFDACALVTEVAPDSTKSHAREVARAYMSERP